MLPKAGVHSFSSDLWSLGCVLHELFLGSPPFTSVSSQQLVTAVVTAVVPKMPGATPEFQVWKFGISKLCDRWIQGLVFYLYIFFKKIHQLDGKHQGLLKV